jgi:selenocysteine lyase/cysteine desulfurase
VHSNTGTRTHIPSITSLCREKDVFTVIDVAQSIGVIPIDIENWQANAVIGSCLKWLCGGSGAGFMWINQNILQDLKPQATGWFSHQNPFEFDISHFDYAHDATRFWGGTPPIAPYVTALAGIDEILTIGVDKVYRHNKHLQTKFANSAGLHEDILSLGNIGGTICLPIQPEKSEALATTFRNQGVRFDQRGHTFRLSFHIYNTETEAEEVGKLTRQHYA